MPGRSLILTLGFCLVLGACGSLPAQQPPVDSTSRSAAVTQGASPNSIPPTSSITPIQQVTVGAGPAPA